MRSFILISLLSFAATASDFSTFQHYKSNFPLLLKDLSRIQLLAEKSGSPQYNELQKDMTLYKEQFDYLLNPLSLETFYQDTKKNKWKNLEKMTKDLLPVCTGEAALSLESCKLDLRKMKAFVMESKLTSDKKDEILSFIDAYFLQINAYSLIDADFITNFNKNVEHINSLSKMPVAPPPSLPREDEFIAESAGTNIKWYVLLVVSFILMILLGRKYLGKPQKKNATKKFYAILFSIAKKNHIQLKIFGNLTDGEVKALEKIQMPLLNTIYLSRSVSSMAQIKFKSREKDIEVEINYTTSVAIQNVMEIPREKAYKDSVEELQKVIESNGGELSITNAFNANGELSQSNLLFYFPK